MKIVLCLGDSLTEYGSGNGGWVQRIQSDYIRKFDLINRGLSGYNSSLYKKYLDAILNDVRLCDVELITLLLGTNDSVLRGNEQFVCIEEFKSNTEWILQELLKRTFAKILLITPPVVYDDKSRNNENTEKYADAVKSLSKCDRVSLVDLFMEMKFDRLLLSDGVHFSDKGNEFLYELIQKEIRSVWPHLHFTALSMEFPYWRDALKDL